MSISSLVARRDAQTHSSDPRPSEDLLTAVAAYVPTEVIAIYTMALALTADHPSPVLTRAGDPPTPLRLGVFLALLIATAPLVWLLAASRARTRGEAIPWSPKQWPIWEACAAMIAFTAWSTALPRSALSVYRCYDSALGALALLVVSIVLPLVGSLFDKREPAK